MASDIWLRTILIVREETRCRHIGYSYRLTARVLLYVPSHRQDNTYHILCYTSRGALAGTRNSSMGPPHEGSIRRPIAPWANTLPLSYVPLPWPRSELAPMTNVCYNSLLWKCTLTFYPIQSNGMTNSVGVFINDAFPYISLSVIFLSILLTLRRGQLLPHGGILRLEKMANIQQYIAIMYPKSYA